MIQVPFVKIDDFIFHVNKHNKINNIYYTTLIVYIYKVMKIRVHEKHTSVRKPPKNATQCEFFFS